MRIVYITAGAGDMYCGSCVRDVNLVNGFIQAGCDVQLIPLYTPVKVEREFPENSVTEIFYGGINIYLQQISRIFGYLPNFMAKLLDNQALLRWVSRFAIRTQAKDLGKLTLSVLQGEHGAQKNELDKLVQYLKTQQPDVINITNSLLSGIAPQIKNNINSKIVCNLQGEEAFVESIPEPYCSDCIKMVQQNAKSVDVFIAPTRGYADLTSEFFGIPRNLIAIAPPGIDTEAYQKADFSHKDPFVMGYLARISPEKGLDDLVEAFAIVKSQKPNVVLKIAGKVMAPEFWKKIQGKIRDKNLSDSVTYCGELSFVEKIQFLQQCSVFSVPSKFWESRAMAVLEAMALGTPVVLPKFGSFPEYLTVAQGGVLCENSPQSLAEKFCELYDSPQLLEKLAQQGAANVAAHYSIENMVKRILEIYRHE